MTTQLARTLGLSLGMCALLGAGEARAARPSDPTAPSLRLQALVDEASAPPGATVFALPWQEALPAPFATRPPTAQLVGTTPDFGAVLWLDQSPGGLRLAIEVADAAHHNARCGEQIWDADAVQLALHPLRPHEVLGIGAAERRGRGELLLNLALARGKAAGWVESGEAPEAAGPWNHPLEVVRDEAARRTRYVVTVPFASLGSAPGGLSAVGLSLWVLDGGGSGTPPRRLRLGASAEGGVRPKDMVLLRLAPPDGAYAALGAAEARRFAGREALALSLRAAVPPGTGPLLLTAHCGSHALALGGLATRLRHEVLLDAAQACGDHAVQVTLYDKRGRPLAQASGQFPHVERELARARAALAAAEHEALVARDTAAQQDAQAAAALLAGLHAQALAATPRAPQGELAELATVARALTKRYARPEALRQALAAGDVPALGTIVAAADQSVQPYLLYWPAQPAPAAEERRPLLVWLHGRGESHLASLLVDVARRGEERGKHTVGALPNAYVLLPWTRGNLGAWDLGAKDVLQTVAELQAELPIDAERTYLAGFSLGGSGAYALAVHAPEPWAAVGLFSAGSWLVSRGQGLGQNARHLPFLLEHGEADTAIDVRHGRRILEELRAGGAWVQARFDPLGGHTFGPQQWQALQNFVAGRRRVHPQAFRYTADGVSWRAHRGISLDVDAGVSPFPRVDVAPGSACLEVRASGTQGLELDLGPAGLGCAGEVRLRTQLGPGAQKTTSCYRGPAGRLTLGTGAARP